MAPLPLQSGAGQRQIWSWPTVEEGRDEEQLEESISVQFASQTSQMTLLSSGSTPLPVMERSEGSSREWDGTATGGVNNILTDIRPDTSAIVRFSEHRKESDTNFEKTGHCVQLTELPNEVLYEILSHLDVCDLFSTSKVSFTFLRYNLYVCPPLPFCPWCLELFFPSSSPCRKSF